MMLLPVPVVPKWVSHFCTNGVHIKCQGLLRAACGATLIRDMPLQSPAQGHRFSQRPGRGGAEAMWFDGAWFF